MSLQRCASAAGVIPVRIVLLHLYSDLVILHIGPESWLILMEPWSWGWGFE